jgi:multiple sugar transport system substrate-binding protein
MSEQEELRHIKAQLDLSRRQFLQRAAVLGVGAASLPLLAACSSSSSTPAPTAAASAAGPTTAPASAAATPAGSARTLEFEAWEFAPDQIKQHLADWTKTSSVPVNLSIIPNVGYGPAMQTKLQGGATIDVYYNFTYNTGQFVNQGWAHDLAGFPNVQDMLDDMFPIARGRYVQADGKIIAAPYFNACHVMMYNTTHLTKAGVAAPHTLTDVYNVAKAIKTAGINKTPYVAYWIKEFMEEYLNVYLIGEGVTMWDDKGNPVFADDPKTQTVFEWWLSMYTDGLTTPTMLTDDPIKLATLMGTGDASMYVLHHYFLPIIRGLKNAPEAKNVDIFYRMPSATGKTFQMGEVIQMGTKGQGRSIDDAWNLMKFYGWKDSNGVYATFKSWASASQLGAPYPGFWADPDVIKDFSPFFDVPKLTDMFANGSDVQTGRNATWYQTFQAKVGDRMQAMLLGQASPKDTVTGLAADAKSAQSGI